MGQTVETKRQIDRQTERQTDRPLRQTDRQTETSMGFWKEMSPVALDPATALMSRGRGVCGIRPRPLTWYSSAPSCGGGHTIYQATPPHCVLQRSQLWGGRANSTSGHATSHGTPALPAVGKGRRGGKQCMHWSVIVPCYSYAADLELSITNNKSCLTKLLAEQI